MDKKTYETLKQCSTAENIPVKTLSVAKNVLNAPGFRGARIDWHVFKEWLDENKEELDQVASQDLTEVKTQNAIKDGILKDLQIAERRGEVLNPKEVFEFLDSVGKAQAAVMNSKEKELSAKVDNGTARLLSKTFGELRTIFNRELGTWIQQYKKSS
jgi:hypothetical protein